jgi:GMP synthase (glutamine-hydrolysing)
MAKAKKPAAKGSHRVATSGDIEVSTYLEIAKEMGGEQPAPAKEAVPRAEREAIIVIDFGSQYNMLIARRVRECEVYCELVPYDAPWERVASLNPKGFILSGGPASVYEAGAPQAPDFVYESGCPYWAYATGCRSSPTSLGGRLPAEPSMSMAMPSST